MDIKWFSPNELLTYNCIYNFVVGDRGGGKSFGTLEFCINQFIKSGKQFVYLRRYERELDDSLPTLFDALKSEGKFINNEIYTKGGILYCDKKVMGYSVALSTSMKKKSISYPNVHYIIFEEFMTDGYSNRYIGSGDSEVTLFKNFYETVDRKRDETRVIFLGNAFSMANIYFTHYGIRLKEPYKKYSRFKDFILVCVWGDQGYREAKKKTRFYQIEKDTDYVKHAYENDFYLDNHAFIKKKSKNSEFHFAIKYMGKTYGIWVDWDKGLYYVSRKVGSLNSRNTISLTLEDNRPNNVNIRRVRNMPFITHFRKSVDENLVYYEDLEAYTLLKEVVYLMRTIT